MGHHIQSVLEEIQKKNSSASSKKSNASLNKNTNSGSSTLSKSSKINAIIDKCKTQTLTAGSDDELSQIFGPALSIFATTVALYGYIALRNKVSQTRDHKLIEEMKETRKIKSTKDLHIIKGTNKTSESVKVTNPAYPTKGTTQNCTQCTIAMAMREKGYDVKAAKLNNRYGHDSEYLFSKAFNSETIKVPKNTTAESLIDELGKNGDGAYGNLTVRWAYGGGHSMYWKNENGSTTIYDGQSGDSYKKGSKEYYNMISCAITNMSEYNRLDNCEPTEYALAVIENR